MGAIDRNWLQSEKITSTWGLSGVGPERGGILAQDRASIYRELGIEFYVLTECGEHPDRPADKSCPYSDRGIIMSR